MKKTVDILKNLGNKMAMKSVIATSFPYFAYQPKPPVKIQKKMLESK